MRVLSSSRGTLSLRLWIGVHALAACIPALGQDNACAHERLLRSAALTDFSSLRGQETTSTGGLKFDLRRFETSFRLPGATSCEITVFDSGTRQLQCDWELVRGLSSQHNARQTYLNTVRGFLACIPKDAEIDESESSNNRGATTSLTFSPPEWPKNFRASIDIEYRFFAPWWYLYVQYRRYKND